MSVIESSGEQVIFFYLMGLGSEYQRVGGSNVLFTARKKITVDLYTMWSF